MNFASDLRRFPILFAEHWKYKTRELQTEYFEGKQIDYDSLQIKKPKGELIYSTCTHSPEENEEVVDYILEKFKREIKIQSIELPSEIKPRQGITKWQDKKFSNEVKKTCRIYPHDNNTEGFFIAKFKKIK